jgi:hypothetical protein
MYPPHVAAMGENQPLQETNKLQNPWLIPVKEVQGYEEPPVKEIVNNSFGADDFSDDGSVYANVSINEDNGATPVDVENAKSTAINTRIDEKMTCKVLSRNFGRC